MTLSEQTLAVAITQIGVQEVPKGSNSGPQVNEYLKSVGLDGGYSWCMAFVFWCTQHAAQQLAIENPLIKTGGVMKQWQNTTCKRVTSLSKNIIPGDIFIMDFGGGNGHTGIVERVGLGCVYTIEGNGNNDGSRNGYEVVRHKRILTDTKLKGFIQL